MQKFIYNIRKQPEEVRRHILHVFTVVAGVVLFSLWVYSLGSNLNDVAVSDDEIKENLAPLSVLKNNLALPQW